jgi:hypothetical protein
MSIEHITNQATTIDVLDRVLDKGIVVDAWVRASVRGIDLQTAGGARLVVASIETYD